MTDDLNRVSPAPNPNPDPTPADLEALPPAAEDALPALLLDLPPEEMPVFLDDVTAPGDVDIDAALAALRDLAQPAPPPPAADPVPDEIAGATAVDAAVDEAFALPEPDAAAAAGVALPAAPVFDAAPFLRPPPVTLQRGQAASVIPAVLLMVTGGWLAYLFITGVILPPAQQAGLALCGAGIMLLAHWLTGGRWLRGSFLMGALLVAGGAVLIVLHSSPLVLPALIVAAGVAVVLTALLTVPRSGRLALIGLAGISGGLALLSVLAGLVDATLLALFATAAPVVLVLAALLLLLPALRRRR
ncbi:MAG: hypothetical protein MUE40_04790 [Anaerolineae bacterium]|nr:hypothetical protein [Anaerolineae bacterium]